MKGLCFFACNRGYWPAGACKVSSGGGDDDNDDNDDSDTVQVSIDPSIWEDNSSIYIIRKTCFITQLE